MQETKQKQHFEEIVMPAGSRAANAGKPGGSWSVRLLCYNLPGSIQNGRRRLRAGGKSGLRRAGCRRNSCGCEPRESAAEKQTAAKAVRVKRRGKSPPAAWGTSGPGKPHPEQGRIGKVEAAR